MRAPGHDAFMRLVASMKSMPYVLCSSIPVAMVRILGSKMMSQGLKPHLSTRMRYERSQISTLRSASAAWPCSSNAITTTAAPYRRSSLPFLIKSSSPSFSEMLFTMHCAAT